MDKEQAKKIVVDTLENPFDKDRFICFIKNLLKKYNEEGQFKYQGNYISDAFEQYISSLERIGKYTDGESEIDLLIVKLKRETSLVRARTAQRNYVANYLKESRKGKLKDAALVAFVSPGEDDWRFSLVKMEYRFDKNSAERVKVREEVTPAKRWSFLVGKNEKSHTAQSRFVPILENDDWRPTLSDLEKAFDVEVVTKEFFEKYRDLFIKTKQELDKVVKKDKKVKEELESNGINTVDFAKKLLGQIVFLYFLQKKGWFGVKRGEPWGRGPKDFMRRLFNKEFGGYGNFYNDILEPLFYEALRTDRSADDHYYSRFNCKIPFLNGGLFDPINNFDWVNVDLPLSDELFSNTNKTKEGDTGDGILDIFDRYNFTVNEEEPLEKEVALDPELLGKIYEKLNAIRIDNYDEYLRVLKSGSRGEESKFNKEYGVYYTPREIVHFMCRESLIEYLFTELNQNPIVYQSLDSKQLKVFGNEGKKGQLELTIKYGISVSRDDLEKFINYADAVQENEKVARAKEEMIKAGEQQDTKYKLQLPESIIKNAGTIDRLLAEVKICDPAVGSGAFPIGMLQEIVKLRQLLSVYLKREISAYDLKRETIENSLYGIDIDPGAIEVCKLRFWLSLIVDEEDFHQIKPLPNLDYKVVCGNSLLKVERCLFNLEAFQKLEGLKLIYFNETNPVKKQALKRQVDDLIFQITAGHKEFDFEVYFSEVFRQKKGFDIVIANPPYGNILSKSVNRNTDKFVKDNYPYSTSSDISSPFIEKGVSLLKERGSLVYIITYAITFNKDFSKSRELLANSFGRVIVYTFDRDRCRTFQSMTQSVSILKCFNKGYSDKEGFYTSRMFRETPDIHRIEVSNCNKYLLPKGSRYSQPHRLPKIGEEINRQILEKLLQFNQNVGSIIKNTGSKIWIRTSGNYWYNAFDRKPYDSAKISPLYVDKKFVDFLILLMNSSLYYFWFRIYGDGRDMNTDILKSFPIPDREKIIKFNGMLDKVKARFMDKLFSVFDKQRKRFLTSNIKFEIDLLDLILGKFLYNLGYNEIVHILNYDSEIRGVNKLEKPPFTLVDKILSAKNQNPQADINKLEREIDNLLYKLYDLTSEEIRNNQRS